MSTPTRLRSRLVAAGLSTVLATSVLALAGPAAQAADPVAAPSLTWSISQQFVDHLSTRALTGGASFDADAQVFSFPGEATSVAADGDVTYSYDGSVRGSFAMMGTEYYAVTIAEPQVTVEADGDGAVTAVVSATNAAAMGNPASSTEPTRVTVAEFGGATTSAGGTSATLDWAGVLPAGSARASELGIAEGKPVDGQSFHPDFLGQLTPGVRAHFYASGAGSDAKKGPGAVSAVAVPTVTATVTAASQADGVTVGVRGVGFNPATNPGDNGVYVGLAPADTEIDFSDRESGTSPFAVVDWVMASRFTGSTFAASLVAPTEKLTPGTEYAVFTWQAHTHSSTTQDTVTPVTIDWSALQAPAKVRPALAVKVGKAPTTRAAGRAVVTVRGSEGAATGKVKVQVLRGSKVVKRYAATLNRAGKVTLRLPSGAKGPRRLTVRYAGDASYTAVGRTVRFRIKR
ncbi:hypothetical protein [Nocardioides pacificus]